MRKLNPTLFIVLLVLIPVVASPAWCQQAQSNRKVVAKVEPEYPHLARSMNLSGVVKLEVVVGGNGNVKLVQIRGGHPVLAEAAVAAVSRWRWERTPEETKELVQINFTSQ